MRRNSVLIGWLIGAVGLVGGCASGGDDEAAVTDALVPHDVARLPVDAAPFMWPDARVFPDAPPPPDAAPQADSMGAFDCSNPLAVSAIPFSASGSNWGGGNNFSFDSGQCPGLDSSARGGGSEDHVYEFTPTTTGEYTITLNSSFDAVLYLATACNDVATTCLGATDSGLSGGTEELVLTLTASTTYYIYVDGWSESSNLTGTYTLDIGAPCIPQCTNKNCGSNGCTGTCGTCGTGDLCPVAQMCVAETSVVGNTCTMPFSAGAVPVNATGDTAFASSNNFEFAAGDCPGMESSSRGGASNDEVYEFTPAVTGWYTITLQSVFDAVLYVLDTCTDQTTCQGAVDSALSNGTETLNVLLTASEPYYIVVDGWSSSSNLAGTYTLDIGAPCITSCTNKDCGSDGCFGDCGTCGMNELCNPTQMCVSQDTIPGNTCNMPFTVGALPFTSTNESTANASPSFSFSATACPGVSFARGDASNDEVWEFTPPSTGMYTVVIDSDFDAVLSIVTTCADVENSCVAAIDANLSNDTETISRMLTGGTTYYIIVDGYSTSSNLNGTYSLNVTTP